MDGIFNDDDTITLSNGRVMPTTEFFDYFRENIDSGNFFECRFVDFTTGAFKFKVGTNFNNYSGLLLSLDSNNKYKPQLIELLRYELVRSGMKQKDIDKIIIEIKRNLDESHREEVIDKVKTGIIESEEERKIYLEYLERELKNINTFGFSSFMLDDLFLDIFRICPMAIFVSCVFEIFSCTLAFITSGLGHTIIVPYLLTIGIFGFLGVHNFHAFRNHKSTLISRFFTKFCFGLINSIGKAIQGIDNLINHKKYMINKENIEREINWAKNYQIENKEETSDLVDINSFDNDKRVIEIIDAIGKLDDKKRQRFMSELSLEYDIYHQDKLEAPYLTGLHIKNEVYVELGFNSYLTDLEARIIRAKNESITSTASLTMENAATEGKVRRLTNDNKIAMPM